MKTFPLFSLSMLFLFPLLIYGNHKDTQIKHTKEKIIKKEFSVNSDATLKVDNSYGNLNVVTWTENRIVIEVHITTNGNDAEAVKKRLNDISVVFHASPNLVTAETIFDKNNNDSWWNNLFQDHSVSMEINYLIKMPITNQVHFDNDYGNINLDRLEGRAVINCDYGKITTEGLMADNNLLTFDYSDNCYFGYIKSGKINADYSGFEVAKTKALVIMADYTDTKVGVAENITFDCDYGEIEIGKANNIEGNGDYLGMRFGEVYNNIQLEGDYGSIVIDRMMKTAGNIMINADYADIEIGIHPDYQFKFSIALEYASLDAPEGFHFSKKIQDSNDTYYEGYYGSNTAGNSVAIESDYGGVEFYVN